MDNSQQPQQQITDETRRQILEQHLGDELLDIIDPKPSEAQLNMEPTILKVINEAKAMRDSEVSNWENMEAFGAALEAIDIDSINPRAYRDPAVMERTRPAKLRIVEMLYDYVKEMPKRELVSFLLYVTTLMGEMEEDLLDGDMGEGYWTEAWLERENVFFGGQFPTESEYDEANDARYKDPSIESGYDPTDEYSLEDEDEDEEEQDMMDESMKE